MLTVGFWKKVLERAIKTFAQAALAVFTSYKFNIIEVDWIEFVVITAGATIFSVLTSIASGATNNGSPDLSSREPAPNRDHR